MRSSYKLLVVLFFVCGTVLRILLYWANPPDNYFDNHFMPIIMIMDSGTLPAKDACFQCYHPPFFYWTSAMIGKAAEAMKIKMSQLLKLLQFLSCFYGICTLGIIFLILQKLPLSGFSRLLAFCAVCFLPRDIYMSAINSNNNRTLLASFHPSSLEHCHFYSDIYKIYCLCRITHCLHRFRITFLQAAHCLQKTSCALSYSRPSFTNNHVERLFYIE